MARGDQALRQWKILVTIMSHPKNGVTQKQLIDEIEEMVPSGKGKRTLQRDLQVLEYAGFPIDRSERTENGEALYKVLPTHQRIPPIMPTVAELVSLSVSRSLLSMYDGTPFKQNLDSLWEKYQAIFPNNARETLENAQSLYVVLDRPGMDFKQHKIVLEGLDQAIRNLQRVAMVYSSPTQGRDVRYTIDPLKFLFHDRCLYLAAYTENYKEIRHFSLDRIREIIKTGTTFSRREHPVDKIRNEAFGLIWEEPFNLVVSFTKDAAYMVRSRLHHPSQQIEELPDGDVLVRIRAGGWDEMKSWIMSFGSRAQVLRPEKMQDEIKKELEAMLEKYGDDEECN
jgi:proteasome accessory factor B